MSDFQQQLSNLMSQLPMIQRRMAEAREKLASVTAEGSAGGGMVTVTVNGKHRVVSLTIDPAAVDPPDVALLEDLVQAAVNQAQENVNARVQEELTAAAGGLPVGDLSTFLGGG